MRRILRNRPSPAMAVALLALMVALGGTGIAASPVASVSRLLSGTKIKKRSIPRDRIKLNAITGAEVKESTLAKVPKATSADNAKHADAASTATAASSATTAQNALNLGGVPASSFTRPSCDAQTGQIRGFVRIAANVAFPATYTTNANQVLSPYNCSGGTVEAKRVGLGQYDVRFNGSPVALALGTVLLSQGDAPPNQDWVTINQIGPGEFRVGVSQLVTVTPVNVDDSFVIMTP